MMRDKSHMILGRGIYSLTDAAALTGSHPNTLRSWFTSTSRRVFESDYRGSDLGTMISFFDLIDAKIAAALRNADVSMQKVRKVYEKLKLVWDVEHPFCYRRFYVSQGEVFALIQDDQGAKMLVEVLSDQGFDQVVMQPFLRTLEFSLDTELAERWRIADGVVLDPEIRLGEPVVQDTRIPAEVIARAYFADDQDVGFVARTYGVSQSDVGNAVRFFKEQRGVAA